MCDNAVRLVSLLYVESYKIPWSLESFFWKVSFSVITILYISQRSTQRKNKNGFYKLKILLNNYPLVEKELMQEYVMGYLDKIIIEESYLYFPSIKRFPAKIQVVNKQNTTGYFSRT